MSLRKVRSSRVGIILGSVLLAACSSATGSGVEIDASTHEQGDTAVDTSTTSPDSQPDTSSGFDVPAPTEVGPTTDATDDALDDVTAEITDDSSTDETLPEADAAVDALLDVATETSPELDAPAVDEGTDVAADTAIADSVADSVIADALSDAEGDAAHDAAVDSPADVAPDAVIDAAADTHEAATPDAVTADAGACDPVAQTGCAPADKCGIASAPVCEANGTVGIGAVCGASGVDDCDRGDLCINEGSSDLCQQMCNVDTDCKGPAANAGTTSEPGNTPHCLIGLTGLTVQLCTLPCNPVTSAGASGCATGLSCTYGGTTAIPEFTDCEVAGTGVEGTACTDASDCAGGLVCVNNGTTAHCRQLCRNATSTDCSVSGDVCYAPEGVTSPMFGFCCSTSGC